MSAVWNQEAAELELSALIDAIDALRSVKRLSAEHTRWLVRTLRFLEQAFGRRSGYYITISQCRWEQTGTFVVGGPSDPIGAWDTQAGIENRHQQAYVRELDMVKGLLLAALDELRSQGIAAVYHGKDTAPEASALMKVLTLVERKLRKVIRTPPVREREIQDALENLLIGADVEFSRESETIPYSTKNYIPDFCLPKLDLVIEVKLSAKDGREKDIIAEINDDILAYSTRYGNQVFVVYDIGTIRDVERFASQFEEREGVIVRVVKH